MSSNYWVAYLLMFATLAGLAVWFRRQSKRRSSHEADEKVAACLNVIEARAELLERTQENYRRKMEEGLKRLNVICDKAQTLFDRNFDYGQFAPSHEEQELKSLVPDAQSVIPSLNEIERVRSRLRNDLETDSRRVLEEQLS